MSGWGKNKDATEAPKFLPAHIRSKVFLTERGWEMQPDGNDNPASSEVIVAIADSPGTGSVNDAPVLWQYQLQTIAGISGAVMDTIRFEIIDMESTNQQLTVTTAASFPAGVGITYGSRSDSEFVISGTPTESKADGSTTGITFGDGTNNLFVIFGMNIAAS